MIKRIAMWKLKNPEESKKMKAALLSLKDNVSSLESIEVGINSSNSSSAFDIVFIGHFRNRQDLELFENDIFHKNVGELVAKIQERRVVVEYEI